MRKIALLLLLVGCRDGRLQAVTKCDSPCFTVSKELQGVGQCQAGHWACPPGGDESLATCEGAGSPSKETCDGIDNNCDGRVDELISRDCSNDCGAGTERCVAGTFSGCTAPPPTLVGTFCYDGPEDALKYGECRPGVWRCAGGRKACVGEVLPHPEVCNGLDDNCNGSADEGLNNAHGADIVFVVDNSGSMALTISAVKQAAQSFAVNYSSRADLRWALVVAPDPDPYYDGQVRLIADLGTASALSTAMQGMASTGGGDEATIDALFDLTQASNHLHVTWTPGSKHVIVLFSDELPQSWLTPEITPTQCYTSISNSGATVYVFTDPSVLGLWQAQIPGSNGVVNLLTPIASTMEMLLNDIVQQSTCN